MIESEPISKLLSKRAILALFFSQCDQIKLHRTPLSNSGHLALRVFSCFYCMAVVLVNPSNIATNGRLLECLDLGDIKHLQSTEICLLDDFINLKDKHLQLFVT